MVEKMSQKLVAYLCFTPTHFDEVVVNVFFEHQTIEKRVEYLLKKNDQKNR